MLFIPYADDNPTSRTPVVTYGIIGLNALVFLVANIFGSGSFGELPRRVAMEFGLVPNQAVWYTFFTSMFLHGNTMHIVGNMVFLWVAADNIEDKIGHLPFLAFYLFAGLFADGAYMLFTQGAGGVPLVGASGAIAGVLGAYMVLFPKARIRIFYWIFIIVGVLRVESRWFLGYWIVSNLFNWLVLAPNYITGVAYAAHVGGFAVGVAAAAVVKGRLRQASRVTRMDEHTGFAPRGAVRKQQAEQKYSAPRPRPPTIDAEPIRATGPEFVSPRMKTQRDGEGFFGIEEAITENVKKGRLEAALDRYEDYLRMRHAKPLPGWAQIEISAELFRRNDHEGALKAYRRYLAHYPAGPDAPEAKFRLGIILARHRNEYFRAREYLLQATIEHHSPEIVAFARKELERIQQFL